jgi:magnesium transporter
MVMKCVAYQNGVSIGDVTIEDISEVLNGSLAVRAIG